MDDAGIIDIADRRRATDRELAAKQPRHRLALRVLARDASRSPSSISRARSASASSTSGSRRRAQPVIINLPATVEIATPNVYRRPDRVDAPQSERGAIAIVLSVHPHNDRGTGVAAAELARHGRRRPRRGLPVRQRRAHRQRRPRDARAQPVHAGHRSRARLLRHQRVIRTVEYCNQLPVHPRHPYARRPGLHGVLRLAPGRDQEGLRRAAARRRPATCSGKCPYLPIDPADLGRSYEAVIRVNSQSGKGGIAYLLERDYGLELPRRLQIEFSQVVQEITDATGKELTAARYARRVRSRVRRGDGAGRLRRPPREHGGAPARSSS